jgi:hypothetical protein
MQDSEDLTFEESNQRNKKKVFSFLTNQALR